MIRFPCRHCQQPIKVEIRLAGKKGRCPKCRGPIRVPLRKGREVKPLPKPSIEPPPIPLSPPPEIVSRPASQVPLVLGYVALAFSAFSILTFWSSTLCLSSASIGLIVSVLGVITGVQQKDRQIERAITAGVICSLIITAGIQSKTPTGQPPPEVTANRLPETQSPEVENALSLPAEREPFDPGAAQWNDQPQRVFGFDKLDLGKSVLQTNDSYEGAEVEQQLYNRTTLSISFDVNGTRYKARCWFVNDALQLVFIKFPKSEIQHVRSALLERLGQPSDPDFWSSADAFAAIAQSAETADIFIGSHEQLVSITDAAGSDFLTQK